MVKVAVAGGSGQIARELVDALVATKKHDVIILTRSPSSQVDIPDVSWKVVKYDDKDALTEALQGVHTLVSFVQVTLDEGGIAQMTLIDSAIAAGVKRFAPSEFASYLTVDQPWYAGKERIREYLEKVNENGKVLEYTLFQPGLLLDYLATPYQTSKHIDPLDIVIDFNNRRALVVEGHEDAVICYTAAEDLAKMVARAVDYDGEWPKFGGIRGCRLSYSEAIKIGEKLRGGPFTIEKVKLEDLEAGELKANLTLNKRHKSIPEEEGAKFAKLVAIGILLSSVKGAWDVPDAFNKLIPDYKFVDPEEFLGKVWEGKA